MKKILLIAVVVLFATSGFASPFLVSDPASGVTLYKITGPAWTPAACSMEPDGSLKADVALAPVGTTQLTVVACNEDPVWGESCSDPVPFSFVRPAQPVITKAIRLIQ